MDTRCSSGGEWVVQVLWNMICVFSDVIFLGGSEGGWFPSGVLLEVWNVVE